MSRERDVKIVLELCKAIVETVKEAGPMGAPAGPMYMAMNAHGITLDQFNQLTNLLVAAGKLRRANHVFYYVEEEVKSDQG